MAKRTSSFRSLGIRNLKSSGNSVAKFTVKLFTPCKKPTVLYEVKIG